MGLISVNYNYKERKVSVACSDCKCRIEISETKSKQIVYQCSHDIEGINTVWAKITRVWHCDYTIKVYINDSLEHIEKTSLKDKTVLIRLDSVALGDNLAWFPYVLDFQKKIGCKVYVSTFQNKLFTNFEHPYVKLIGPEDNVDHDVYYKIGIFTDPNLDPYSFRTKPLQKSITDILGLSYREKHLDLRHLASIRPIKEKYVVICNVSTMDCKEWRNPAGWQSVVDYLKSAGYKVVCIPESNIKLTGLQNCKIDKDLIKGALTYIKHAEMLVGLSSGLSWLARSLNIPVVMISGFTEPFNEFKTGCERIINRNVCHGCYHDSSLKYDRYRGWCPRNKSFECSRGISSDMVIEGISKIINVDKVQITNKKKIMCVLPHCSTGGLPQYFLEKLKILRNKFETYVVEWSFHGEAHNVQRKQIRELCTEFIEIAHYKDEFQSIVDNILPDIVHFEEFPSMFPEHEILWRFHELHRQPIIHTSHSYLHQPVWKADVFYFPSAYHKIVYPELNSEIIEFPIMDNYCEKEGDELSVLNVGIISEHKNQRYLVDIARKMPDVKFYMAGSFADNFINYWKPLIASAPKNCIFLGQQNEKQISVLYKKCSIMFHTSTIELCPIVFPEALSYGLPILVNWLAPYECLPYKQSLNKASMKHEEDIERIRTLLKSPRVRVESTYNIFEQKVLQIYAS